MILQLRTFIGKYYNGMESLFEKAKANGECFEKNGKWWTDIEYRDQHSVPLAKR